MLLSIRQYTNAVSVSPGGLAPGAFDDDEWEEEEEVETVPQQHKTESIPSICEPILCTDGASIL